MLYYFDGSKVILKEVIPAFVLTEKIFDIFTGVSTRKDRTALLKTFSLLSHHYQLNFFRTGSIDAFIISFIWIQTRDSERSFFLFITPLKLVSAYTCRGALGVMKISVQSSILLCPVRTYLTSIGPSINIVEFIL